MGAEKFHGSITMSGRTRCRGENKSRKRDENKRVAGGNPHTFCEV